MVGGGSNTIEANHIGVSADGTTVIGNSQSGVLISSSTNNIVTGNMLGGNATGIGLQVGANNNTITANAIGTDPTGTSNLANTSDNVTVFTDGNIIGGTTPGSGNVIANAGRNGVYITGQRNQVLGNSIFGNTLEGIALDALSNANANLAAPTLTTVTAGSADTTAAGSIAGGVAPYTLELFTTPVCDASGRGEGRTFLGRAQVAVAGRVLAHRERIDVGRPDRDRYRHRRQRQHVDLLVVPHGDRSGAGTPVDVDSGHRGSRRRDGAVVVLLLVTDRRADVLEFPVHRRHCDTAGGLSAESGPDVRAGGCRWTFRDRCADRR